MTQPVLRTAPSGPEQESPQLQAGDMIAGRYEIDGFAGEGGMAVVYSARHLHLDERYAVKILRPQFAADKNIVSRFLQEARAAAQLRSEHTCRVFDVGLLPSGAPFLVMELLVGEDLRAYLERHAQLRPDEAVEFTIQACEALAEAHAVGIVHRDIKPENLFVMQRSDGWRSVKLLDFGISKVVDRKLLSTSVRRHIDTASLMGSPHYMAPEQIRSSQNVDARADLWSLGVVLYELLCGQQPFQGETVPEISASILEKVPPALGSLREGIPPKLLEVIQWCLAKPVELRVSSASELAVELMPFGPRRSRAVVERMQSLARSHGEMLQLPASVAPPASYDPSSLGPAIPPQPALPSRLSPQPPRPARRWALLVVALLAAFAIAGLVTWRMDRSTPRAPTTTSPLVANDLDAAPSPPRAAGKQPSEPATTASAAASPPAVVAGSEPDEPDPPSGVEGPKGPRFRVPVRGRGGAGAASTSKAKAQPTNTWDNGPDLGF